MLGRWVAQGGFAGEGVVPRERQKLFKGLTFCRTTNFGSNPKAAHCALRSKSIGRRVCVSKNVCHQTLYSDGADGWHAAILAALRESNGRPVRHRALEMMHKAMSKYLSDGYKEGKKIHDPLALAVALDESVCTLAEVELGSRGPKSDEWGCWLSQGSGTWISVDYDEAKFRRTLLQDGFVPRPFPKRASADETKYPVVSASVSMLSNTEKEVLKLAKKLREIMKLEKRKAADGVSLDKNQENKISAKEDVNAEFLETVKLLPAVSDVIATVRDLMPATEQVADNPDDAASGDAVPATQQLACNQVEVNIAAMHVTVAACDEVLASRSTELQPDLEIRMVDQPATGQVVDPSADSYRRWRQRGGRSGFRRQFDRGFVAKHAA
jgi:hypothetical protein